MFFFQIIQTQIGAEQKDGTFRENFNSVDLTEVEFYDDNENEPRNPNEKIVEVGIVGYRPTNFHYFSHKFQNPSNLFYSELQNTLRFLKQNRCRNP